MRSYRESDKYKKDQVKFCLYTCKGELRGYVQKQTDRECLNSFHEPIEQSAFKIETETLKN